MRIDPEPVRHSGTPVGIFACRDLKYTWYYDQRLHVESGVSVTFTERENFFDGRFVNRNNTTIHILANDSAILRTRWCSGHALPHYAQTRFKGKDESGDPVIVSGQWVRLLMP